MIVSAILIASSPAMLKFNAASFFEAASWAHYVEGIANNFTRNAEDAERNVSSGDKKQILEGLESLKKQLQEMDAKLTLLDLERFTKNLRAKDFKYKEIKPKISSLNTRLIDEISLVNLFVIDARKAEYYNNSLSMFGEAITGKFPSIITDVEDAGRSLACAQGTATVFHLMRVMETGLRALSSKIGVNHAPTWDAHMNHILKKIGETHKDKSEDWKKIEGFCREIVGDLQIVKISWRNPTMHISRRYSADEAEQIFIAVRGFMLRLSAGIEEINGEPSDDRPC